MGITTQPASATTTQAGQVVLRCSAVSKSFMMGDALIQVLKHVDLAVKRGEFIAIEGRSGSGKSTLMHLLGALDVADGGEIEYDGRRYSTLAASQRSFLRNRDFGFVFQFYHLLPELNVLDNTLLPSMVQYSWLSFHARKAELRERARQLLDELGLAHRLKHRPNQLSGGERQRVAIARALMNDPKVLFADEPTGNLDAETGLQIMSVLQKLHRQHGQTIVMVTHDRELAREQADRVLLLQAGQLAAEK